jgi:hypothetical protein
VEAQEILRDLIRLSNVKYSEPFGTPAIHVGLGERDQVFVNRPKISTSAGTKIWRNPNAELVGHPNQVCQ